MSCSAPLSPQNAHPRKGGTWLALCVVSVTQQVLSQGLWDTWSSQMTVAGVLARDTVNHCGRQHKQRSSLPPVRPLLVERLCIRTSLSSDLSVWLALTIHVGWNFLGRTVKSKLTVCVSAFPLTRLTIFRYRLLLHPSFQRKDDMD